MKYVNYFLRVIVGILALVVFLPVLAIAVGIDLLRLLVNFKLFIFANMCFYASGMKQIAFKDILANTNYDI